MLVLKQWKTPKVIFWLSRHESQTYEGLKFHFFQSPDIVERKGSESSYVESHSFASDVFTCSTFSCQY